MARWYKGLTRSWHTSRVSPRASTTTRISVSFGLGMAEGLALDLAARWFSGTVSGDTEEALVWGVITWELIRRS